MNSAEEFVPIDKKLSEIFGEAFVFVWDLNRSSEPTNSTENQVKCFC